MYVDDGVLFACSTDWDDVAESLSDQYTICADWLTSGKTLPNKIDKLVTFISC
jgi:hypothetical protein